MLWYEWQKQSHIKWPTQRWPCDTSNGNENTRAAENVYEYNTILCMGMPKEKGGLGQKVGTSG